MDTIRTLKKIVAGAVLSGGLAVAGAGLAAGTAQTTSTGDRRTSGARGNPCRRPAITSPTHFAAGT